MVTAFRTEKTNVQTHLRECRLTKTVVRLTAMATACRITKTIVRMNRVKQDLTDVRIATVMAFLIKMMTVLILRDWPNSTDALIQMKMAFLITETNVLTLREDARLMPTVARWIQTVTV